MKIKFMKLKALMLSGLIFCSAITMSQERELPLNIQSPNSASLGSFGNAPVNYYTGRPNITVPIHSLKAYGLSMDIYLSYDASGIQIDRHPGWVGQNWNLQAGGVITRTVRGRADEYLNASDIGDIFNNHFQSVNATKSIDALTKEGAKELILKKAFALVDNGIDLKRGVELEPDIFSFNFMGISGKFFYGGDKKWKVLSDQNIEVLFDVEDAGNYSYPEVASESIPYKNSSNKYDKTIAGFKLRDDKGMVYVFGYKENSIEYGLPFFNQLFDETVDGSFEKYPPHWTANSWYLTRVIDKHGNELFNLDYTRGYWIAEFYRSYVDKRTFGHTPLGVAFLGDLDCSDGPNPIDLVDHVDGTLISPVYLEKITSLHEETISFGKSLSNEMGYDLAELDYKLNKLEDKYANTNLNWFCYTTSGNEFSAPNAVGGSNNPIAALGWYKLDEISINTNQKVKYVFNYNNNSDERLFLESIDIEGLYRSSLLDKYTAYKFGYNQPQLLPKYLSKKVDHWGYYKGSEYVIDNTDYSKHFATRNSNEKYLQIGILKSVSYPTGGYTTYKYEPNAYSSYVSNDRQTLNYAIGIAGGLRIKEIQDFDGIKVMSRTFKYQKSNTNTQSSGILNAKPNYYWEDWKTETDDGGYYHERVFSINSVIPLSNSFESHIGYSDVLEYKSDGSYIHYSHIDHSDVKDQTASVSFNGSVSPYEPLNELGYARGKMQSVKYYDSNNSIVKEVNNTYRSINEITNDYVVSHNAKFGYKCDGDHKYFGGNVVKIFYNDYDLISTNTIDYLDGKELVSIVDYDKSDYDDLFCNYRFLNKLTETKGNDVIETSFKYPKDLTGQAYMNEMISSGRLGEVIETRSVRNQNLIEVSKFQYKKENNLLLKESVKNYDSYNNLTDQILYKTYDLEGNPVEYQGIDGINMVFVYGYKKKYPIAVIKNVDYGTVQSYINSNQGVFDDLNTSETSLKEKLNALRSIASSGFLTSYTYNHQIGITSITDPNNNSEKYGYDVYNRLNRVYDHDGKILQNIEYNYAPYPILGLNGIWSFNTTLQQASSATFYTTPIGGSGDFSYKWSLGDVVKNTNEPSVTIIPEDYGTKSLSCEITDNETGKAIVQTKSFYIRQSFLLFENIRTEANSMWSRKSFDLKSPLNDVVSLTLLSLSTNGARFKVGSQIIEISGYGSRTVQVSTVAGQKVPCEIEITGQGGVYGEISITDNQNSKIEIGTPKSITISL
jgi:hypothetical protein